MFVVLTSGKQNYWGLTPKLRLSIIFQICWKQHRAIVSWKSSCLLGIIVSCRNSWWWCEILTNDVFYFCTGKNLEMCSLGCFLNIYSCLFFYVFKKKCIRERERRLPSAGSLEEEPGLSKTSTGNPSLPSCLPLILQVIFSELAWKEHLRQDKYPCRMPVFQAATEGVVPQCCRHVFWFFNAWSFLEAGI